MVFIVFDFDDTLFPSSHLTEEKNLEICPELIDSINQILETASRHGQVIIITNAHKVWVKNCVEKYLPGCHQLQKHLEGESVFSTLDDGLTKDTDGKPVDVSLWKTIAFQKKFDHHFKDGNYHHLVCFGDNYFDRLAALYIKDKYKNVLVKNVLFMQRPSLELILRQHKIIAKTLQFLSTHQGHLDLVLTSQTISSLFTRQKSS